jgi:hypothetical protein
MKAGPDISRIAALIGNPANANMLMALAELLPGTTPASRRLGVPARL